MTREDVAKAYIQSAQGRAARAGVIAFGAGLALVVMWSLELQDRTGGLLFALGERPRYENLSRQRAAVAADNAAKVEKLEATKPDSKRSRRLTRYVEDLKTEAGRLAGEAVPIEQRTAAATRITFTFPGLPPITVRDASAALVWLACAAALLHYLAWCRRSVLILYSRALRILVSEQVAPSVLHDIAGALPFWIAPLPRGDGAHVSANLLRSAAGWDRMSLRNHLGLGAVQIAAGLVALHVVYLGVLYSQLDVRASASGFLFRNTPTLSITVILGIIFVGIAFWWLTPGRVPDTFSFEGPPSERFGRGRRAVIVAGLGLVAGAVALVAVSPATVRKVILRARYRRWANRVALDKGFYEVGRNKRIHYSGGEGRPKALKSVPDRYIRPVQIDRNQASRVHVSALGAWLEAATESLKVNESDLAKEGMDSDLAAARSGQRPTLVWFDYSAQRAWKAKDASGLEQAIASLGPFAETQGGQAIDNVIRRRRGIWLARLKQLKRSKSDTTKS